MPRRKMSEVFMCFSFLILVEFNVFPEITSALQKGHLEFQPKNAKDMVKILQRVISANWYTSVFLHFIISLTK